MFCHHTCIYKINVVYTALLLLSVLLFCSCTLCAKCSLGRSWPVTGRVGLAAKPGLNTLGQDKMSAIFQTIFSNAFSWMNVWISINISLNFVPNGRINNSPALVQIMAWHRPGDKSLSEPMMVSLPMHICVTQPQWVKWQGRHVSHSENSLAWNVYCSSPVQGPLYTWMMVLTYWGMDKMATVLPMTFWSTFFCMEIIAFWFKFRWNLVHWSN